MPDIQATLAKEFSLPSDRVGQVVQLIDDGNTIPFIARYRKEATGEMDDQVLRRLSERLEYLRSLEKRREEVRSSVEEQGHLTTELAAQMARATTLAEIEDLYRPFKPKRRTRASIAREKGLEALAAMLWRQDAADSRKPEVLAAPFVSAEKGVADVQEALAGARDILAEDLSDDAALRGRLRRLFYQAGTVVSKGRKKEDSVYRLYYDFSEPVSRIAGHRTLAIDRGEREEFLEVSLQVPEDEAQGQVRDHAERKAIRGVDGPKGLPGRASAVWPQVALASADAWKRLIQPSLENEVRGLLTEDAQDKAMHIFSANLRSLLLSAPVRGRTVMGLDPAYRTGCKLCVVDPTGRLLTTGVIYPTPPHNKVEEARRTIRALVREHGVELVAIGNGTASKETEIFVGDLIREDALPLKYLIVSEAGASVYSASKLGAEEFPEFDVSLRSAVSIARRLQDPLAELVKIDPKAIGVGQYQHDMNQKKLGETLGGVVEDCVNAVGVDLNTASPSLLSYVAGIQPAVAKNIAAYRVEHGAFRSRQELRKVPRLGDRAFEQCAGFLRIPDAADPLDRTSVHPESYEAARIVLKKLGSEGGAAAGASADVTDLVAKAGRYGLDKLAGEAAVGVPTLRDILDALARPGRDPRESTPQPELRSDVMSLEDLKPGMVLGGVVRNVAEFGAFVDIGVHQDGLVHVSELSDTFVRNPLAVVSTGDAVRVRVLSVDVPRKRISLSMKGL